MKADMEAIKEQMATMIKAMMSMKKIMEANAVIVAATSAVAKVNPMLPSGLKQMNHPTSNMVGKDLGSTDDPMMCKFKTSTPSRHMACLSTIRHPMWRTLPIRMSITPLLYPLRANNPKLIMHMSLKPWGRHMKFPTTIYPTSSLAPDMPLKGKQLVVYPYKTLWKALSIIPSYTSCIPQQVKTLTLWQKWESWII